MTDKEEPTITPEIQRAVELLCNAWEDDVVLTNFDATVAALVAECRRGYVKAETAQDQERFVRVNDLGVLLPTAWLAFEPARPDGLGVLVPSAPMNWPEDWMPMGDSTLSTRERLAFDLAVERTVMHRPKIVTGVIPPTHSAAPVSTPPTSETPDERTVQEIRVGPPRKHEPGTPIYSMPAASLGSEGLDAAQEARYLERLAKDIEGCESTMHWRQDVKFLRSLAARALLSETREQ